MNERAKKLSKGSRTHGHTSAKSPTSEYIAWSSMKARCSNPHNASYANYGRIGIRVCKRWRESFESFIADMGLKPTPGHSIDRVDNGGSYTPENCRWATRIQRANNKRSNVLVTLDGETRTLTQWQLHYGISPSTYYKRLNRGWLRLRALTTPVEK